MGQLVGVGALLGILASNLVVWKWLVGLST